MNRLLVLSAEAEKYTELIKAAGLHQLEIRSASDIGSARCLVAGCNMILGDPPLISKLLPSAEKLEWVQSGWAGVDDLCREGLRRDYTLTNAKGIFGPLVSEYVMTYVFGFERRIFDMRSNQSNQNWQPLPYRPSKEISLGIIGLGSIGRHLALTARHFGIRVTGLNRSGKPCDEVDKIYTTENLDGFLENLDYVVLTLPATSETTHLIDKDVLSLMKPSSILMNVGRGNSINEEHLAHALREGVIGGAVLDVFETEPLPQDSPLWQLPNVWVTPHTSANSFPEDITGIFIENYQRFLRREPLLHVVDFELGY